MSAAGLASARQVANGLRPALPRRDLAAIADLIETCFASTLDAAGRSAIREMRLLSRTGPLLWLLVRLNDAVPFMRGFVWIEQGRVVGNVTLTPAGFDQGWVIANVAVYPEFRRRGIARQLMLAALDLVARRGRFATLQVEADNDAALALYHSLGFETQRAFSQWRRAAYVRVPPELTDSPPFQRLARRDAEALYALAARARPDAQGGMGWLRPTRRRAFYPPRFAELRYVLSGQRAEFWIVPSDGGALDAALRIERRIGGLTALVDLLVDPARQGQYEAALVNFALRRLVTRGQPIASEHPADDVAMGAVLLENHFRVERTLAHMIWRAR
jgi:ribosomal protein S18 acetylase RimI-like enzyme